MIKKFRYIIASILIFMLASCDDNYLEGLFIEPVASFSVEKSEYQVLETVKFNNTGDGTTFVVWPGNTGHCYGKAGNTGFAAGSDGVFSYSYDEPGEYEVVWIASSIDKNNNIVSKTISKKITIVDNNGGLDKLVINKICKMTEYTGAVYYYSYGEFVSSDTIMCPILWSAWKDAKVNTIKSSNQLLSFSLTSSTAKMYWYDKLQDTNRQIVSDNTASRFINFMDGSKLAVQRFIVETSTGNQTNYYVAPVMIPAFTSFEINGVSAVIKRNIAFYNRYDITLSLPSGTDLSNVVPEFVVMNNDANLLDGTNCSVTVDGVSQASGVSSINLSQGDIIYKVDYYMLGADNKSLKQTSYMHISIN